MTIVKRMAAAGLTAVLISTSLSAPASADNQMGYQVLSASQASSLPNNGGALGMDVGRASVAADSDPHQPVLTPLLGQVDGIQRRRSLRRFVEPWRLDRGTVTRLDVSHGLRVEGAVGLRPRGRPRIQDQESR